LAAASTATHAGRDTSTTTDSTEESAKEFNNRADHRERTISCDHEESCNSCLKHNQTSFWLKLNKLNCHPDDEQSKTNNTADDRNVIPIAVKQFL
jgi:hypothetical protein